MALAFMSKLPEGVLVCNLVNDGRIASVVERGEPPDMNRARVGEGEVEALGGERDRGTATLFGDALGEFSCLEPEVVR